MLQDYKDANQPDYLGLKLQSCCKRRDFYKNINILLKNVFVYLYFEKMKSLIRFAISAIILMYFGYATTISNGNFVASDDNKNFQKEGRWVNK